MCGGFVWEWCDHAIAHGKTESGKTIYYYGGDHDEELHDGIFVWMAWYSQTVLLILGFRIQKCLPTSAGCLL